MGQEGLLMALYGLYRGTVSNNSDPEGLGRLKVIVPQALGQNETDWAWPAGPNVRDIAPLDIGDPVWVGFEGGAVTHPVVVGTWAPVGRKLDTLPRDDTLQAEIDALTNQAGVLSGIENDIAVLHWMTRVTS
jgi:Type VI secretion system/phage-baseplate injector OB domain